MKFEIRDLLRRRWIGDREIGLALPTSTILQPNDLIYQGDDFEIIVIGKGVRFAI